MKSSQRTLRFASISGRKIEAEFDGGTSTSDAGALLLRQAEAQIGIIDRVVAALSDRRHQSYVDHSYTELIRQRVFQIACGYQDANDSNDLRSDPGFKTACGRLPVTGADLASQPTMSRLENSVSRSDLYRMALALLEGFIASYEQPPKMIILDIDDTDDTTHGAQQLTLFNAYHDDYCYMPVHLYEGHTGKLITTLLRPGCRMRGEQAAAILKRVLDHLLMVWPRTRICLRGDSHFSTPQVHDLCDDYGIDFILGQAVNKTLKQLGAPLMAQAEALADKRAQEPSRKPSRKPVRLFSQFDYQAGSWGRPRRIIYKAEITQGKANPRFLVTNIRERTPRYLYEKAYCARGRMEGFIKNHKTFLHSDRTSCHRFAANQFRLFLHSIAYVLLHTIKHRGLRGTQWVKSNFDTIQLRLLKIGARVQEQATRVCFHLPTSYPLKDLMRMIVFNLDTA
jgi:hypothetical protein